MFKPTTAMVAALLAATLASAALSQDGTTVPAVECEATFIQLDTDGNGLLSETEAPREHARSRVKDMAADSTGMAKADYLALCNDTAWAEGTPVEGAPFEGANSFTETQARDRALSRNVTEVSALTLDDKGIWRGKGKVAEAAVSVAVDYQGNVVTTP